MNELQIYIFGSQKLYQPSAIYSNLSTMMIKGNK